MSKYLGNRSQFPHLAAAVGALIIYGLVLALAGDLLAPLGLEARDGILFVPLYGALIIYPAYRLSGWVGTFAALSATLLFFAIPLIGFWDTGGTNWFAFGGIVPASDGLIYYYDAQRLAEGFNFSFFSARRPWLAGTVAALLLLWQHQLQWALASLVAFTALSAFLLARELRRTHGPLAVAVLLIIVVFFSREWLGFVYTEHLGLAFGMLALAFLWRSATDGQAWMVVAGMGLLMLGLLARAGTFFILPMLLIWIWFFFRNAEQRVPWRLLGSVVGVLVLAVGLNMLLIRALGPEESRPISNFSYTLYGIASGGEGWHYVNVVRPEILAMEEPELSDYIYARALEQLQQHPENFFIAYSKAVRSFFSLRMDDSIVGSIFVAGQFAQNPLFFSLSYVTRGIFLLLLVLGCIWSILQRRTIHGALLFCGFIGILASLSFAPPIDAVRSIKYAATIPFIFLLMAIGCVSTLRLLWARFTTLPARQAQPIAADPGGARPLVALAAGGAIFMIGGALITQAITQPVNAAQPAAVCAADETQYLIRANGADATTVFAPDQEPTTRFFEEFDDMENLFMVRFQGPAWQDQRERLQSLFASMQRPFMVFRTVDLEQGHLLTIIMEADILEDQPTLVSICAEVVEEPQVNRLPTNRYVFVHHVHAPTAGTP
jgi:hypothetical protein